MKDYRDVALAVLVWSLWIVGGFVVGIVVANMLIDVVMHFAHLYHW